MEASPALSVTIADNALRCRVDDVVAMLVRHRAASRLAAASTAGPFCATFFAQEPAPSAFFTAALIFAVLGVLAGAAMAIFSLLEIHHPLTVIVPMMFYTAAVGITMPQAMSVALAPFPDMSATASALLGFLQMGAASVAGVIVGLHLDGSALPMALTIAVAAALSLLGFVALIKSEPLCYDERS